MRRTLQAPVRSSQKSPSRTRNSSPPPWACCENLLPRSNVTNVVHLATCGWCDHVSGSSCVMTMGRRKRCASVHTGGTSRPVRSKQFSRQR